MGDDDDDDDTGGVDAGSRADADIPEGSFTVDWGPVDVAPGEEDTRCIVAELGNTETIEVNQIYNYLGDVSHHFIVYKASSSEPLNGTPESCTPFAGTLSGTNDAATPLAITQKFEETLTLPDGVGFVLEPNQKIRLELHYINASDTMKTVQASATFTPMADGEFQDAAGFLFAGDVNIEIPPGAHSLGPTYIPLPADLAGVNVFALTGHVHKRGTDVTLELSEGDTAGEVVYDIPNFDWDEPETVRYDPELVPPSNSGFRITCEWYNETNSTIGFGESANEEMCFFWGYYYPDQGSRVCVADSGSGLSACCPGDPLCGFLEF